MIGLEHEPTGFFDVTDHVNDAATGYFDDITGINGDVESLVSGFEQILQIYFNRVVVAQIVSRARGHLRLRWALRGGRRRDIGIRATSV